MQEIYKIYIYIYTHTQQVYLAIYDILLDGQNKNTKSVDSLTFSINIGDIIKMKRY